MAQNETRIRLIKGRKIVGKMRIRAGCVDFMPKDNPWWKDWEEACNNYVFDSFELGILMPSGEWYFEGDIFEWIDEHLDTCRGVLTNNGIKGWSIIETYQSTIRNFRKILRDFEWKHIGNIHDK